MLIEVTGIPKSKWSFFFLICIPGVIKIIVKAYSIFMIIEKIIKIMLGLIILKTIKINRRVNMVCIQVIIGFCPFLVFYLSLKIEGICTSKHYWL